MKRKTLYIILASIWVVALITLVTVCIIAFGDKNNDGGSSIGNPPSNEQPSENEDEHYTNSY